LRPLGTTTRGRGNPILVAFLVASVFLVCGCGTYAGRAAKIREPLSSHNYDEALKNIEEIGKNSSELLYLYERGLVLHYRGNFDASNECLEKAEIVLDDLYTRSVSREATALITSDNITKYRGEPFEAAIIHYYKIMNFLYLGRPDGALVECRKLNHRLQVFADLEDTYYPNDPFLQYLTGLVYFSEGEYSDADVSLRAALEWFQRLEDRYGIATPDYLYCDLARSARRVGDIPRAEEYAGKCSAPRVASGGTVNLFLECGYVPFKEESNVAIPIFEGELDDVDEEEFAERLALRFEDTGSYTSDIKYLLKVSIPVLSMDPARFKRVEVSARSPGESQSISEDAELVANIEALSILGYDDGKTGMLIKTIGRALTKYLAKKTAEDEGGKLAGLAVNVFGVVTERADTRNWTTLPQRIYMAQLTLPPGEHDIEVDIYRSAGLPVESFTIHDVEVRDGRATFLNYRVY
jgi:hypothetical protein